MEIQPIDLKKPTVFILGAGASTDFGFPTGLELKERIIASDIPSQEFHKLAKEYGFTPSHIKEFRDALSWTEHSTIDMFLNELTNFRDIGAFSTAYSLLKIESREVDNIFKARNWYRRIFNCLIERDNTGIVVFVTLNYERSLEHYLYGRITSNKGGKAKETALQRLGKIKIIHPHGSLGQFPKVRFGDFNKKFK